MLRWIDVIKYAKYSNPEPYRRVEKTEEEWQGQLTPAQYQVAREKGTEKAYRNAYCRSYEPGVYVCIGCGEPLFDSTEKYHAISGWPSFTQPITKGAIKYAFDDSHNMHRMEAMCNVCDCHLGHVFPDGPEPTGLRYCINSESLNRINKEALATNEVTNA
ncbi:peptide-methionine (R)-S-oxide reductase MsrB [Pontibacter harenae]|uniref:peptide-methionine (R)-S-oxide reductase MsrB n=1 Tax=Pontibacter harenae TaxID=2894083 RepID=UPI001E57998D|nr:peptide-methionine (R)-S-oxide reductase MsrB [Pontibacter harenae]MCC9165389.1 peptide-methionine (R)-S-oxide reductase MsrB [Pontibacter harenae]